MKNFEDERRAARNAIEDLGHLPLGAESTPSQSASSKSAMLAEVAKSDAVVLILGRRYGWVENESSPTEDEYNHAIELRKDVYVFKQDGVEHEPKQKEFIDRVLGGWTEGRFVSFFTTPAELQRAVTKALAAQQSTKATSDLQTKAQVATREFAMEEQCRRAGTQGRVAFAPVMSDDLLDASGLLSEALPEQMASVMRSSGLVPQSAGIEKSVTGGGGAMTAKSPGDFHSTTLRIRKDGAVCVTTDVSCGGSDHFGTMIYSLPAVQKLIRTAGSVAGDIWKRQPRFHAIRQFAGLVVLPDTEMHPLSLSGAGPGNSMGIPSGVPSPLLSPDPAQIFRLGELQGSDALAAALTAPLQLAFTEHNGILS